MIIYIHIISTQRKKSGKRKETWGRQGERGTVMRRGLGQQEITSVSLHKHPRSHWIVVRRGVVGQQEITSLYLHKHTRSHA